MSATEAKFDHVLARFQNVAHVTSADIAMIASTITHAIQSGAEDAVDIVKTELSKLTRVGDRVQTIADGLLPNASITPIAAPGEARDALPNPGTAAMISQLIPNSAVASSTAVVDDKLATGGATSAPPAKPPVGTAGTAEDGTLVAGQGTIGSQVDKAGAVVQGTPPAPKPGA